MKNKNIIIGGIIGAIIIVATVVIVGQQSGELFQGKVQRPSDISISDLSVTEPLKIIPDLNMDLTNIETTTETTVTDYETKIKELEAKMVSLETELNNTQVYLRSSTDLLYNFADNTCQIQVSQSLNLQKLIGTNLPLLIEGLIDTMDIISDLSYVQIYSNSAIQDNILSLQNFQISPYYTGYQYCFGDIANDIATFKNEITEKLTIPPPTAPTNLTIR